MNRTHDPKAFIQAAQSCIDVDAVKKILNIIISLPDDPAKGKKGGCLAVCDRQTKVMTTMLFGEIPEDKENDFLFFACEKLTRVIQKGNLRSFQSQDKLADPPRYGGGISRFPLAVSFSGLPAKLDEALSFVYWAHVSYWGESEVATKFGEQARIDAAMHFSDNEFVLPVLEAFIKQR